MTPETRRKLAGHIMRLLKVRSVSFPIAITDKGPFSIKYVGDADYEMVLDAVPLPTKNSLDDDYNIELKAVLEKYWFEEKKDTIALPRQVVKEDGVFFNRIADDTGLEQLTPEIINSAIKAGKKGGRPKGAKNKVK
jgi:hypothetical protein